jgi:hypothetical protein
MAGTMKMPPPTPSNAPKKPATHEVAKSVRTKWYEYVIAREFSEAQFEDKRGYDAVSMRGGGLIRECSLKGTKART